MSPRVAHAIAVVALAAWLARPARGQIGTSGASPGSVFIPTGSLADFARDLRASQTGDIVTIVVNENASAVASGTTNTQRKATAVSGITALGGSLPGTGALANLANLSNNQQIQSTGQTSRTITVTTTISARVVDVTPNGTLIVEGSKNIGINSEKQVVTVRGYVRPADLTTANTVNSTQVADLQVHVNGKGVVNDAIKRPFFLYRILMGLLPF